MSEHEDNFESQEFDNEVPQEEVEQQEVESEGIQEEEVVEVKQKAKSTGHLSPEEYKAKHGSLKGYKTEDEFVRTGDMIEQIYSLKKKLDQRDNEVEAILNYQRSTIQEHKRKARQEIEAKLREAREYGNVEAVEALVQQRTQLDYVEQQESMKQQLSTQQKAVEGFIERNKHWFNDEHPELKRKAAEIDDALTKHFNNIGRNVPLDDLAKMVEDEMSRLYPDVVRKGTSARPAISAAKSTVNKAASNFDESEDRMYAKLTQDQKWMYQAQKRIQTKGGYSYSMKDFVRQLKEDGEL
jgi:hypothetical protein